jgi:AcrR family transcriptional regulator
LVVNDNIPASPGLASRILLTMPNRTYHHGDLRAALLEQAEQTLRARGEAALSLRELARDLGVSHAAPSRHFKDRRALLDALALAGFERMTARLTEADRPGAAFGERLTVLAHATVDFAVREPEMMALMFSRKQDSDALEEMHKAWMRLGAPVFATIADGQRTGDVHEGDLERIAVSAFACVHGVGGLATAGMLSPEETTRALDDALGHLIKGLKP